MRPQAQVGGRVEQWVRSLPMGYNPQGQLIQQPQPRPQYPRRPGGGCHYYPMF